jgi:hypothetical protein
MGVKGKPDIIDNIEEKTTMVWPRQRMSEERISKLIME